MSLMTFCGGDLFPDLILGKGQPETTQEIVGLSRLYYELFLFPRGSIINQKQRSKEGPS